jgi:hypothetical protein
MIETVPNFEERLDIPVMAINDKADRSARCQIYGDEWATAVN